MSAEEIFPLESVLPQKLWPNEAHDFTPWLAKNIDRLGTHIGMEFEEDVRREVSLPGAGKADIVAVQAGTDTTVVIENQLGASDNDHCLRLLGYAAHAETGVLVWVARSFSAFHRRILEWLNEANTIDAYAVTVQAYRVGETPAADFRTVVAPPSQPTESGAPKRPRHLNTLYAAFYRPLVERLRRRGVRKIGRGGWQGRWRSFETGHAGARYATRLEPEVARVFLSLDGPTQMRRFRALREHSKAIEAKVDGVQWHEDHKWSIVSLDMPEGGFDVKGDGDPEPVSKWMADSMVRLRDVIQPHLDQVVASEQSQTR